MKKIIITSFCFVFLLASLDYSAENKKSDLEMVVQQGHGIFLGVCIKFTPDRNRYIYNDLIRRSGAIVFSSSQGGEFSYEKDEYENGLFTEAIIKGLAEKETDKNKDGTISTDELINYVIKTVPNLSDNLQHPTVDRDNIYQKFGF